MISFFLLELFAIIVRCVHIKRETKSTLDFFRRQRVVFFQPIGFCFAFETLLIENDTDQTLSIRLDLLRKENRSYRTVRNKQQTREEDKIYQVKRFSLFCFRYLDDRRDVNDKENRIDCIQSVIETKCINRGKY